MMAKKPIELTSLTANASSLLIQRNWTNDCEPAHIHNSSFRKITKVSNPTPTHPILTTLGSYRNGTKAHPKTEKMKAVIRAIECNGAC
jgi:hypothetical protein